MVNKTASVKDFEQLEILAEAGLQLSQIADESDIYSFISRTLSKLIDDSIILTAKVDESGANVILTDLSGIDNSAFEKIKQVIGFDPIGSKFKLEDKYLPYKDQAHLWEFEEGLAEFLTFTLPKSIAKFIQSLLNIHKVYFIGIVNSYDVYGNIVILARKSQVIKNIKIVESFVYHCSTAISKLRVTRDLEENRKRYYRLFHELISGFTYCEIVSNKAGEPINFRFLDVNPAYEKLIGYKREDIISKLASDVFPYIDKDLLARFGTVALNGGSMKFEKKFTHLNKYIELKVFSPEKGRFAVVYNDITQRRLAEEASRERQTKLNSIFSAAPIGIGIVRDRVFFEVNNHLTDMLGYSKEELIGKNARFLYPTQEDYEYVGAEKYRQIAQKESGTVETRWQKKDGSIIFVLLSSSPFDMTNLSAGVTFTAVDITERINSEMALLESEEKFRNAFLTGPDSNTISEVGTGLLVDVNEGFLRIYGYAREEVIGKTLKEIGIYKYPEKREILIGMLKETGKVENFETEFVKKDGSTIYGLLSASIIMINDIPHILGINRDITEMKRIEREIQELNNHLEKKVEERTAQLNEALEKYKAEAEERIKIQEELEIANTELLSLNEAVAEESQKLLFLNEKLTYSERELRELNKELEARVEMRTQELREAKNLAESASKVKSIILNNLGHELRTPLNGAMGFMQLLIDDLYQQDHLKMANVIFSSMKRLEKTLNSLLILTNLESGIISLKSKKTDLSEFLGKVYESFKESVAEKGLKLIYKENAEKISAVIDEQLLNTILFNLLDNAVKFTQSGNITIELELLEQENATLEIKITDTGIGIHEYNFSKIFEPFRQESEGLKRVHDGLGLGLFISQKLARIMNGELIIKSKAGEGTSALLHFPAET